MNYSLQLRNASTWQLTALRGIELSTKGAAAVFSVLGEALHFIGDTFRSISGWSNQKAASIRPDGKPLKMPGAQGGSMKDEDIADGPRQSLAVPDEFNRDIDITDDDSQDNGTIIEEPPPDTSDDIPDATQAQAENLYLPPH